MRTKEKCGIFYCASCGAERQYKITQEIGWSTASRGYTDKYSSDVCSKCGDRTIYDDFSGSLFVIGSKCPSCRKKISSRWNYCMHCGNHL